MAQAIWKETVIAESNDTIVVEGNHYFPPEALHQQYFKPSEETSYCGWKGTANYYDVVVDGEVNMAAAWFYADPKPEAEQVRGYVAFWKGITISAEDSGPDLGAGKAC